MSNEKVSTLNWIAPVPTELAGKGEWRLNRPDLEITLQNTTSFCIDGIVSEYGLDSTVSDAIYNKIAEYDTRLAAGGVSEYNIDPNKAFYIGSVIGDLGNVTLLPNAGHDIMPPKEKVIFLSVNGIMEEAMALKQALDKMMPAFNDNKGLFDQDTSKTLLSLTDDERLLNKATALAYARRLLKYGLLRNEDIPQTLKGSLGFSDWLEHCKTKQGRIADYPKNQTKLLQKAYNDHDLAARNLRYTVWTNLFYSIVGIDPDKDPFFYIHYAEAIESSNNYTITFNGGETCRLSSDEIKEGLEIIFTPKQKGLKSV